MIAKGGAWSVPGGTYAGEAGPIQIPITTETINSAVLKPGMSPVALQARSFGGGNGEGDESHALGSGLALCGDLRVRGADDLSSGMSAIAASACTSRKGSVPAVAPLVASSFPALIAVFFSQD
jgi:hypothetical protein